MEVGSIEKILHNKEKELDTYIENFATAIKSPIKTKNNSKELLFFDIDYEELDKEGFSILIYKNDSLKYWSNNLIELSETYSNSKLNERILEGKTSIHAITNLKVDEFIIVGLIKLKNTFEYKNKYLKNDVLADFGLPEYIDISKIPLSHGFDVKDKNNEYIFSLVPDDNVRTEQELAYLLGLLYILSALFLLLFISTTIEVIRQSEHSNWWIFVILLGVVLIKYVMLKYKLPRNAYSLPLFDSQYYASSFLYSSLGDFIINSLLIAFLLYHLLIFADTLFIKKIIPKQNKVINLISGILGFNLIFFFFFIIHKLLKSLIIDSKISFEIYNVLSLDLFSVFGIIIFILLISVYLFLNFKIFLLLSKLIEFKFFIIYFLISIIPSLLYIFIFNSGIEYYSILFVLVTVFITAFTIYREQIQKYYIFAIIAFFTTLFITTFITSTVSLKQDEKSKVTATKLIDERDAIAELLISDVKLEIKKDETVKMYISDTLDERVNKKVKTYLRQKYFTGYWNKYDFDIYICSDLNKGENYSEILDCQIVYTNEIDERGEKLSEDGCYLLKNDNGSISYFFSEPFQIIDNKAIAMLYVFINPKLIPQDIGYPELLLDEKIKVSEIKGYSYAKYENHTIITKSGEYKYPINGKELFISNEEISFINSGIFRHVIYRIQEGNYIVLTSQKISLLNYIITFAYIFVLLNIIIVIIFFINKLPLFIKNRSLDFRSKLILSMFFILTLSFFLIGSITVYYNITQFKSKHKEAIEEKLQSILIMLRQEYQANKNIDVSWNEAELNSVDYKLIALSDVFRNDINLYNSTGKLIATSRSEIFRRHLINRYINPDAFFQLKINKESEYINNEKISILEYASAYIPLENEDGKLLAYINIPFFTNPEILQKEISNLLVTMINLYVVLFIVSIIIAIFLSEQVVFPLRLLQTTFQRLEVGKQYEHLDYRQNDEIGELVTEYNKMVDKLHESIDLLAKSERESAWREMAKQIAHEIKNPLTPMKLSIQFLLRSWNNNDDDFGARLEKVSETLIEQIEALRKIATEFSAFAKMPKSQDEIINLVNKIENIIQLYENTQDVDIKAILNGYKEVNIIADNKQMSRVFVNLIRNAIQSIPNGLQGKIFVSLEIIDDNVKITIEDNGTGMNDDVKQKLFTPSFTTKTKGMGLGLSMVKNIVNNAKGKIWFDSKIGRGTKFFLQFPLNEDKE